MKSCEIDEKLCKNKQCLRNEKFCDNERDCIDFSDEFCFGKYCGKNQYSCLNECIPTFQSCNTIKNCGITEEKSSLLCRKIRLKK